MKHTFLITILFVFAIGCSQTGNPDEKVWIKLFNGKDISDWDVKISGHDLNDNFGSTFHVEDSLLKVSYTQYDSFRSQYGHIFYKQKFSHYLLKVEYRFVGNQVPGGADWALRNSGAMLHAQSAQSMLKNQDFPISIEAQFLGGLGTGPRSTANLCTPGTNVHFADTLFTPHCISSKSKTYDGDQWVSVELLVLGDSIIRHVIGGETVLEYTKPEIGGGVVNNFDPAMKPNGQPLTEGYIALQSESHPVEFRKVELLNLKGCKDPKAKNFKSYYVVEDSAACIY